MGRTKPQYQKVGWEFAIQHGEVGIRLKEARSGKEAYEVLHPGIYRNFGVLFHLQPSTPVAIIPTTFLDYEANFSSLTKSEIKIDVTANIDYRISEPVKFMESIPEVPHPINKLFAEDATPAYYGDSIVKPIIESNTCQVITDYKIEEVNKKRGEIEEKARKVIEDPFKRYGLVVGDLSLRFTLPGWYTSACERGIEIELQRANEVRELELNAEIAKSEQQVRIELAKQKIQAQIEALGDFRGTELEYLRQQTELGTQHVERLSKMAAEIQQQSINGYSSFIEGLSKVMGTKDTQYIRDVIYTLLSQDGIEGGFDLKIFERIKEEIENEFKRQSIGLENRLKEEMGKGGGLEEAAFIGEIGKAARDIGIEPREYLRLRNTPRRGLDIELTSGEPSKPKGSKGQGRTGWTQRHTPEKKQE